MKLKLGKLTLLALIISLFFSPVPAAVGANPVQKHVLVLHPFTPDDPAHQSYNKGLINVLGRHSEYTFSYSYEYFDYGRHSNDQFFFENMAYYLKAKYKSHQPDFIVTEFNMVPLLQQYGEEVFGTVPVITTWKGPLPAAEQMPPNYICILQPSEPGKYFDLILRVMPNVKGIYIVVGASADERRIVEHFSVIAQSYADKVEFVWVNKLPYRKMLETVGNAGKDSAILYFHWFADVEGNQFQPAQVLEDLLKEANGPVFGNAKQFLGSGMVGGYMRDFEVSGQVAANAILEVLKGKKPAEVKLVDLNVYVFDWRQLKHWGIEEERLPEGSRIEFVEISLWEQYGAYIIGGFVFMGLQTMLIVTLLINRSMRKKAELELIEANRMKDEFLINTSHELQTPLNGIINISESLLDGKCGAINKKQEEELTVILAVSRRLSSLINDIIDLEKIKRNELRFQLASTDLKSASSIVLDVLRHLSDNSAVEIAVDIPANLSPVIADENRLIQVLFNLLGNSIKFTERGRVVLSACEEDSQVKIMVEDTGIGMTEEQQTRLFRAFSQGSAKISEQYGGSGLGLFISRQLLERMGGHLQLEWSEPGRGTCISFTLLKSVQKLKTGSQTFEEKQQLEDIPFDEAGTASEIKANLPVQGFKVLAVDDEPTNLRVLKLLLEGDGYQVLTASGGMEALELIKRRKDIDLVLMDVMMSKMSGYEACRKIREDYSLYDLPVLMLTVRNTPEDIAAGFEAGANDFVVKPFVAKELRARVGTLLEMKRSAQDALKSEMAFLTAQIKPHFLYNTLNTIAYFCVQDGRMAQELLNRFAEYLRRSFDFKNLETYVSLKKELGFVNAYLDIEKARFGNRLQSVIDVEQEALNMEIPPLILQPLVENAVLHGIMKKLEGGTVVISVKRKDNTMEFTVQDNGVGMTAKQLNGLFSEQGKYTAARSVGVRNIHLRLKKLYGKGIQVFSEEGQGTTVTFSIPVEGGDINDSGHDCR